MKPLLFALLLFAPLSPLAAAHAASPEETYFTARDAFAAKFTALGEAGNIDEEMVEDHQRARDELGKLLRPIVGPVAIKGFLPEGRTNLDSLFSGDEGFGLLDGMLYSSADDKTHVVVTTQALFTHWLVEHQEWWGPKHASMPQDVGAALKSEAFYTQALLTDAAITIYTELAVARPAKAKFAVAVLVARAQILGPQTPNELIVSVVQGGRVFVASVPANAKVPRMPLCERFWQEAKRKSAAALEGAAAAETKAAETKAVETQEGPQSASFARIEEEGDAAFHRCFAQHAKGQGFFAALSRQAQGLVGRLSAR